MTDSQIGFPKISETMENGLMRASKISILVVVSACSDYEIKANTEPETPPVEPVEEPVEEVPPVDSGLWSDTADAPKDPVDIGEPVEEPAEEECNGVDDDGDGEIDEGFDENENGIADCLEEESYCTPFDDFSDWSYSGSGDWHIESGLLTESRGGLYDAIASLYDLGTSDHFVIEVDVGWTGSLNDFAGIAWAVDGHSALVVRWDDPQNDYRRHHPPGAVDLSFCEEGVCTPIAFDHTADLYRPADKTFSTLRLSVDHDLVTVTLDGVTALSTTAPSVVGTGPAVVGLYSNDNDGGVWYDNFCVWKELQ